MKISDETNFRANLELNGDEYRVLLQKADSRGMSVREYIQFVFTSILFDRVEFKQDDYCELPFDTSGEVESPFDDMPELMKITRGIWQK